MSYITFDYKCADIRCRSKFLDRMVHRDQMNAQVCDSCGSPMIKMPAGPPTTFKFADRSARKSKKAVSLRDPQPGVTRPPRQDEI